VGPTPTPLTRLFPKPNLSAQLLHSISLGGVQMSQTNELNKEEALNGRRKFHPK